MPHVSAQHPAQQPMDSVAVVQSMEWQSGSHSIQSITNNNMHTAVHV